ncbi:MAG: alanine racemase [Thermomicrobiales bacterium]|nr:alanine racemase [Thermomicrobiales bacterium]
MFLDRLLQTNPVLALAATHLHQRGAVRANTYLLDLDAFRHNADAIKAAADAQGLTLYFMSKQFARNPDGCRTLLEAGVHAAVAVDMQDMEALVRNDIPVGHVGHLVSPHRGAEDAVIAARPEVVTLFALESAERIGSAARRAGVEQDVLLRVTAPGDRFYPGHGGGFPLAEIEDIARAVTAVGGLRVVGVTTFPCLLFDRAHDRVESTPNFATLRQAADRLCAAGFDVRQVNAPGTTSATTMAMLAAGGATHVEPGNAFHGTAPQCLRDSASPEIPGIVYVSEVSHVAGGEAFVYAAGYYVDNVLGDFQLTALCGRDERIVERRFAVETAPDGAIHYHCMLKIPAGSDVRPGDTVVFCFRPQIFVTRGRTQAVIGVAGGDPRPLGIYDVEARPVEGVA